MNYISTCAITNEVINVFPNKYGGSVICYCYLYVGINIGIQTVIIAFQHFLNTLYIIIMYNTIY